LPKQGNRDRITVAFILSMGNPVFYFNSSFLSSPPAGERRVRGNEGVTSDEN
jgi:hypothetical protein